MLSDCVALCVIVGGFKVVCEMSRFHLFLHLMAKQEFFEKGVMFIISGAWVKEKKRELN